MYEVIIIGSGPAGYAAALYTSRALLKTKLLAGIQPGGQLTTTTHVENYPGFPNGILGPKLMEEMKAQAGKFGAEVVLETVKTIHQKDGKTVVVATDEGEHEARSVIIATGASAKLLGIPSEQKFWGKGISACATCDGFFFRGKEVVVIGGGDTAMEEATFLTRFASHVTIVHRREGFRASPIILERARKDSKITFLTNKVVEEILGDTTVSGVRLKDTQTGEVITQPTQGVFLAIGHKPNTEFLKGFVGLDEKGYVVIRRPVTSLEPQTETSVPGVFAAGDCVDPRYRQAVVAAGMGVMAAIDAQKFLEERDKR